MTPTLRERLEGAIGAQPDGLGSYFAEDSDLTTKDKLDALEQLVNELQDKAFAHGMKKGVELRKRTDQILPPTLNQETPTESDWEKEFDKLETEIAKGKKSGIIENELVANKFRKNLIGRLLATSQQETLERVKPYVEHLDECNTRWEIGDEKCSCGLQETITPTKL